MVFPHSFSGFQSVCFSNAVRFLGSQPCLPHSILHTLPSCKFTHAKQEGLLGASALKEIGERKESRVFLPQGLAEHLPLSLQATARNLCLPGPCKPEDSLVDSLETAARRSTSCAGLLRRGLLVDVGS